METYYDQGREQHNPRIYPYKAANPAHSGHIEFKSEPHRIATDLEDFRAFSNVPAIQTFYAFLRWLNGPESHLESSDCLLRPPSQHTDSNSSHKLCVTGRLILMFRNLSLNTSQPNWEWFCGRLMMHLGDVDPAMPASEGVVGFSLMATLHTEISNGIRRPDGQFESTLVGDPGLGRHLMLTFWAYGENSDAAFANLDRVFGNIWEACRRLSTDVQRSIDANQNAQAAQSG